VWTADHFVQGGSGGHHRVNGIFLLHQEVDQKGSLVCPRFLNRSNDFPARAYRGGAGVAFDAGALAQAVSGEEVLYEIDLPGEGAETELFFSDLSYDYVKINAEYTT